MLFIKRRNAQREYQKKYSEEILRRNTQKEYSEGILRRNNQKE